MRRRTLLTSMAAAALTAGLAGPTPARAAAGLPNVIRAEARDLFPEGVAWDPYRRTLLVGSFTEPARISAVGPDGRPRTVVSEPGLPGFFGLHVDEPRGRLLAVYGNPSVAGSTGVGEYDLATGARRRLVDLSGLLPGAPLGNDLAIAANGTAYVSVPAAGAVYRVPKSGRPSVFVRDERLAAEIGANGIVWHPDGYLLTVNYMTGGLLRIPLHRPGELTEVWTSEPLTGGDGMALWGRDRLIVVTNTLGTTPGAGGVGVHVLQLLAGGRVAWPVRTVAPWPDPAPTTVAVTPYGPYVLDGRLDAFLAGSSATDLVLRRLPARHVAYE